LPCASKVAIKISSGDLFDDVSLLAKDERRDLAILKIKGFDLPVVGLGNSNDLKPGDQVIVIGNPLGAEQLQASIADGIVSGIRDLGEGYKVIQLTAPISPGNSGGPALSELGEVVGVIVFRLREGQSLNFAVPINYVRGMLDSIDKTKSIAQWKNTPGAESVFSEKSSARPIRWKSLKTRVWTKLV
jgi:S1-C subfamily serine protease